MKTMLSRVLTRIMIIIIVKYIRAYDKVSFDFEILLEQSFTIL